MEGSIGVRRERGIGKQAILGSQIGLTTKELTKVMIDISEEKKKKRRRTQESPTPDLTIELKAEENMHEELPTKNGWILGAVVV